MKLSRTYKNLFSNIIVQVILALSGIIIPKLIILKYGSALNGMVGSIGQFLMYAGLVEAGIGNAAIVSLYNPLMLNDTKCVSTILSETARRYKKSGIIYTVIAFGIACIYPVTIRTQIDYSIAFSMTIVLALIGVIDFLIIGKYKVLLTADNKYYIINFSKAITSIFLVCGSVFLLSNNVPLIMVKILAVLTHMGEAIFIKEYVKKNYAQFLFDSKQKINLEQQSSALIHQICMVITYNTDMIVLTLCLKGNSLLEISVYSVYSIILSFAKNMMSVLCTGINASFGMLYAKKDTESLVKQFKNYELIFYICLFTLYCCFMALIVPFVRCYVGNTIDVEYVRIELAILFTLTGLLSQLKDAYGILVNGACGAYKETRKYAICEAVINLLLSIAFVKKWGIAGVLIGTIVSHIFMDFGVMRYGCKVIVPQMRTLTFSRIIRNVFLFAVISIIETKLFLNINNWIKWGIGAVIIVMVNLSFFMLCNYLFERESFILETKSLIQKIIRG